MVDKVCVGQGRNEHNSSPRDQITAWKGDLVSLPTNLTHTSSVESSVIPLYYKTQCNTIHFVPNVPQSDSRVHKEQTGTSTSSSATCRKNSTTAFDDR